MQRGAGRMDDRSDTGAAAERLAIPRAPRVRPADVTPRADAVPRRVVERPVAAGNGAPSDPEAVRVEIERTRERMSRTLDAIEDRLVQRKQELWARATLQGMRRRITTEPWRSLAIAFAAGYIVAAIRD
jgi:ElaB/YqjD/DUF883 family membrane-anchored ribosome-binding protein